MPVRRSLAALLVLPLVTALAAQGNEAQGAAAGEDLPRPTYEITGPVTPRATTAIDTGSKAAVQQAYRRLWVRGQESRPRWRGGSVAQCRPGRLADTSTRRQLDAINFARRMSGLAPLVLDPSTRREAQAAALIMTAKHAVSHYPPRDWPCWTQEGFEAARQSNLYEGTSRESNSDKIEAYLDDWGGSNHRVGHRRWLLYPYLDAVGIGGTRTANVTHLFGSPFDGSNPNPQWVSWPTAGWFPSRLDPRGRWSLSSGADGTDFSSAKVEVVHRKRAIQGIQLRTPDNGVGKPTLVWEMPARTWPGKPVGTARVTVSGIVVDGVPGQVAAYEVRFFRSR